MSSTEHLETCRLSNPPISNWDQSLRTRRGYPASHRTPRRGWPSRRTGLHRASRESATCSRWSCSRLSCNRRRRIPRDTRSGSRRRCTFLDQTRSRNFQRRRRSNSLGRSNFFRIRKRETDKCRVGNSYEGTTWRKIRLWIRREHSWCRKRERGSSRPIFRSVLAAKFFRWNFRAGWSCWACFRRKRRHSRKRTRCSFGWRWGKWNKSRLRTIPVLFGSAVSTTRSVYSEKNIICFI